MKFTSIIRQAIVSPILFVIVTSREKEHEYFDDLFVGNQMLLSQGYGHYDNSTPFPALIEFKNDSLYLTTYKNETRFKTEADYHRLIKSDTFKFIDLDFVFRVNKNKAVLRSAQKEESGQMELHFHKAIKTPHWTKEEVFKTLTKGAFTSTINKTSSPNSDFEIKKSLHFKEDSLSTTLAYYYKNELIHQENHSKSYVLSEVGDSFFFTENDDPHNPHTLFQISALDKNGFSLYYYDDQKELIEEYILDKNSVVENVTSFTNCKESRPYQYYHGDFTYLKGNDYIIEKVSKNAPQATGNGYITVHFIINCHNQIGQLGLEQMDRSYQPTNFNASLVKHIVDEVLTLEDWPENRHSRDIHAFLMFKIDNGKITDLCP